jgi:hypothetical protein
LLKSRFPHLKEEMGRPDLAALETGGEA